MMCRCLAGVLVEDHPDQNHVPGEIGVCAYVTERDLRIDSLERRHDP